MSGHYLNHHLMNIKRLVFMKLFNLIVSVNYFDKLKCRLNVFKERNVLNVFSCYFPNLTLGLSHNVF